MLVESLAAASGPTSEEDGLEGSPLCWRTHNATPDIGQWTVDIPWRAFPSGSAASRHAASAGSTKPARCTALEHFIISGYLLREKELLD